MNAGSLRILEDERDPVAVRLRVADSLSGEVGCRSIVEPHDCVLALLRVPDDIDPGFVADAATGVLVARDFVDADVLALEHPVHVYVVRSWLLADRASHHPMPRHLVQKGFGGAQGLALRERYRHDEGCERKCDKYAPSVDRAGYS